MTGRDQALPDQFLNDVERPFQDAWFFDVRGFVTQLAEHMGQGRSTKPVFVTCEIDEQERATARELEVWRNGGCDVWATDVGRDDQRPGRLDDFVAVGSAWSVGRHGEAVLASVHGDTQLEHDIVHGLGSIVECSALTGQFGRPHPVAGTLYILQPGRQRPDDVRQCLPHTHAAHSSRIDQPFDGLLTYCGGGAGRTEMTLGDDSHVGDGEL